LSLQTAPSTPRTAGSRRPIICLVTDRHRLAERLGLDPDGPQIGEHLADLVARAADAAIDLVQLRENDLPGEVMARWARRFVEIAKGTRTRILVNDRLDIALAAGADGVHLKDEAVAGERVRAVAPRGFVVGQSIHSPHDAATTDADYVVYGTVFPTRSKSPSTAWAGLDGLKEVVRHAAVPVLCIGGVTLPRLAAIAGSGAAGIAAVDLFLPQECTLRTPFREIVAEVRQTFDTAAQAS
jgi:thiamine-phosphate pyrophosphorylase